MDWLELEFFEAGTFDNVVEKIKKEKEQGREIFPPSKDILRALVLTPPEDVKVVILGQDPYPTKGHANGLSFSVNPGVKPLPKSLVNIFKELQDDLGIQRTNGDLSDWARQGVLLLNSVLTVREKIPQSHEGLGWEILTTEIMRHLNQNHVNLVYILWGAPAQLKERYIDPSRNLVLKSSHPSPRAAYRGFFGSKPFSQANKYLTEHGKSPIDW